VFHLPTGHCGSANTSNPNPDFTKWLGMVWEALPEEDQAKRKEMLQDANAVLEQLRPEATPESEHPD
jgi:hypothetical protein